MASSPTRVLTFQEKVQRKRRNKAPLSGSVVSTTEDSRGDSPDVVQVKNQLGNARGVSSASLPSENRASKEHLYHLQQVDYAEIMRGTNEIQRNSMNRTMQAHEKKEGATLNELAVPKMRKKLPKWPPEPESDEEENSEPVNEQSETSRTVEKQTAKTEPSPQTGQSSSVGKAPWIRTGVSPTTSNNLTVAGKATSSIPSWLRPAANEETPSEATTAPATSQQRAPSGTTTKNPWSRVQTRSPNAPGSSSPSRGGSQQKTPWTKPSPAEQPPLPGPPIAHPCSQQKMPWVRPQHRTPSLTVNTDQTESQQKPPWVRSEQQTPSPLTKTAGVDSQQQKSPWARPQRTSSPVTNLFTGQSQKSPWVKSPVQEETSSPVSTSTNTSSPSRRRWVRLPVKERTPSPLPDAGNVFSQQKKAPWVRSANEETPSPATDSNNGIDEQHATLEQSDQASATKGSCPRRQVESLGQRRARILKRKMGLHSGEAISSDTSGIEEMAVESVSTGEEERASRSRSVSRTKRWPPVRTEQFSNGYKHQQQTAGRTEELETHELSAMTAMQVEEQPLPQPSHPPPVAHDPSPSMQAHTAAVRKGPWLRTSPSPPTMSSGKTPNAPDSANKSEIAEPSASQQKKTWGRRSPSPIPTDEGNQNSLSWAHSAANPQFRSPLLKSSGEGASKDKSFKQKGAGHSYKKPPPSPYFGKVNYVPPWVKAREEASADASSTNESDKLDEKGNECDQLDYTEEPLQDDLYAVPSDEIGSPPLAQPKGKQSIESLPSPSIKILNEVKTRRVLSSSGADSRGGENGSEEVAEVVVSYGGAVIETPKSVSVASMASSFASGEKFSSPTKQKPPNGQKQNAYGGSPQLLKRPVSKQSTSPGDQTLKQPHRLLRTNRDNESDPISSSEHSNRSDQGRWGQEPSPPPSWSEAARSNGQQNSMHQRDLSADKASSPLRKTTPARSPPPPWIKRDVSQGDRSSIKSPQWGSKAARSRELNRLDRSPPPSWVNRDVSQGDMSSIRSPDWSTKHGHPKSSVDGSRPPSWVDGDAGQDELSPIESPPPPSSMQRKVRITVETVDDESIDEGITDRHWSPEPQTAEYEYPDEAENDNLRANVEVEEFSYEEDGAEHYESAHQDFDEDDVPPPPLTGLHPPKSPSTSLVQMAMDSVFALDFDRALSQAGKEEALEEDDDSAESSASKGIAKSTPPERELPAEVKALLERSLNRIMSDSGAPDDSGAYEADYFSTDIGSAVDQSGSTWNENDISALSNGSWLPPNESEVFASSYDKKDTRQFSADDSTAKSEPSEVSGEALEQLREMNLKSDPRGESETGSSSAMFGNVNTYGSDGRSDRKRAPRISFREEAVDVWSGVRVDRFASSKEELISSKRGVSFMNFATNELTIDLGNPNDFSIQVSPDSPQQARLVGTSPALLSDSPPEELPSRSKTVRFGGPESHRSARLDSGNELTPTVSSLLRGKLKWSGDEKQTESRPRVHLDVDNEPPPTVSSLHRGTGTFSGDERDTESCSHVRLDFDTEPVSSLHRITENFLGDDRSTPVRPPLDDSRASAGAKNVLEYYKQEEHEMNRMENAPEAEMKGDKKGHVDWPSEKPPPGSREKSPTWSKSFGGQDPFTKQDARDPFFKQDDPFATSRSASSEFASDFGDGFNPFTDTEANDAFDFEQEEANGTGSTEFFSPYGDAPKGKSTSTSTPTKLTPSRRDRRRHREASVRYDDFFAQKAASDEQSPSDVDDSYVEYCVQRSAYTPSGIGRKDGTYLLEI